ncbi:MAG: hypothetical protein LUC43_05160 [Burkholderiales bacterium]|nr:hypothetical protein [Burkholderiales bacterium]
MLGFGKCFKTSFLLLAILEYLSVASATEIYNDYSDSNWYTALSTYASGDIAYSFTNSKANSIYGLYTDSASNDSSYELGVPVSITLNNSSAAVILGIYSDNASTITSSSPISITLENASSATKSIGGIVASAGGSVTTGDTSISITDSSAEAYLMGILGTSDSEVKLDNLSISFNSSTSNEYGSSGVILINGAQAILENLTISITNSTLGQSSSGEATSTAANFYGIYTGVDIKYALSTGLSDSISSVQATSFTFSLSNSSIYGFVYGAFASSDTSIAISNSVNLSIESGSSVSQDVYGMYATGLGSASSGSIAMTLSGSSIVNESLYGAAAVSTGVIKTGNITLDIKGGYVASDAYKTVSSTANVYGLFVSADGSSATSGDITISLSDETVLGAALFGVRAVDEGTATVGDVSIEIENSYAGAEVAGVSGMDEETSLNAQTVSVVLTGDTQLNSMLYGVRSSKGAEVNTGEVNLVVQNSTVSSAIYGVYSSELGQAFTGNVTVSLTGSDTTVGGNIYGANVLGSSTLGDVTVKGTDFTASGSVYTVYDTGTLGQASDFRAGDVFMKLTGATAGDSIVGLYTDATASGSYSVGEIEMEIVDTTLTNAGNIFGHATYATSETSDTTFAMTASIAGISLTVTSTGTSENPVGDVAAIYKQDAGTLNVSGTTGLWVSDSITYGVAGAVVTNGTANLQNVTLVLTNVATTYGSAGLWIGKTPDSGTQTVDSISVAVDGNINVTFLSGDEDSPGLTQNLYGVVISSGSSGTLLQTGGLNISLVGNAESLQGGSQTIYGSAVGSTESSYSITGGRTLYFGSEDNNQNYSFTSSEQNPFLPSFANFDSVIVRAGSSLYITTEQNETLSTEASVFGTEVTSTQSSYLDGIVSQGGTVELPANTTFLVDSGALADIHEVENNGTVYVYENGTLVLHQGSNSSSISGLGTVIFSPDSSVETYGIATASLTIRTTSNADTTSTSTYSNSGTIDPDYLVVDGGNLINTGSVSTGNFTINSGTFLTKEGNFTALGSAYLEGGTLYVGEGNTVGQAEVNPSDAVNSAVYVVNGIVSFGASSGLQWAIDALADSGAGQRNYVIAVTTPYQTGDTGLIAAGTDSAPIDTGLYFANGTAVVVNASALTANDSNSVAHLTTSSDAQVVVDDGAILVLQGDIEKGRYNITKGYSYANTVNGWGEGEVYAIDTSGIKWSLVRGTESTDADYVFVTVTDHDDVTTIYPNVVIPNISNNAFNTCSSGDPGDNFICSVLRNGNIGVDEKTKILNSVANIAFAGGSMAISYNDLLESAELAEEHLTMRSDTFTENMTLNEKGTNFWIDVMGKHQRSRHLSATGLFGLGYSATSFGFILGLDQRLGTYPAIVGGAFSFDSGNLKSREDVLSTKNKYQSYGLHLYANWTPSDKLNLIGSFHWLHNNSDINQKVGSEPYFNAQATLHTDLFALGLRAETAVKVSVIDLIPHLGARYLFGNNSGYATKLNGQTLWTTSSKPINTLQIPVGFAVRGIIATASGWRITPNLDVSVIPQIGSSRQRATLSNHNGITDNLDGQFSGKFGASAKVGLRAETTNTSIGIRYGFIGGTKGRADSVFMLEGRLRF